MEPLDLPVGLWAVGAGPLVSDVEHGAGVSPGVGTIGRSVVGEDPFDGDAVVSEPCDGAFEHADRGDCLLVRADLDVGDAGVVVDDGVEAIPVAADVADPASLARAADAVARVGPPNVLVLSAGVMSAKMTRTMRTSPDEWQRVMSINLDGAFECACASGYRAYYGVSGYHNETVARRL